MFGFFDRVILVGTKAVGSRENRRANPPPCAARAFSCTAPSDENFSLKFDKVFFLVSKAVDRMGRERKIL